MSDYLSKVAELTCDVSAMWQLQCRSLYASTNLAGLAVRECLQNSVDAIHKNTMLKPMEGIVNVNYSDNWFSVSDNGVGMDAETLHTKFLNLGGTTKNDGASTGGFGVAKAVILGCGTKWEIQTQNLRLTSDDLCKNPIQIVPGVTTTGTTIKVYDAAVSSAYTLSDYPQMFRRAALEYISASEIPDVTVKLDGKSTHRWFPLSDGINHTLAFFGVDSDEHVPKQTKVRVRLYPNGTVSNQAGAPGVDRAYFIWVRLNGLLQFKKWLGWEARSDVVVDINTTIDPRDPEYPFSTNRESLNNKVAPILESIAQKVHKNPIALSSQSQYKESWYDNANDNVEQDRKVIVEVTQEKTMEVVSKVAAVLEQMNISTEPEDTDVANEAVEGQGAVHMPSLLNAAKQLHTMVQDIAKEQAIPVEQVVANLNPVSNSALSVVLNPLSYSWLTWEYKADKIKVIVNNDYLVDFVIVWDTILRMMMSRVPSATGKVFYPGIILEDNKLGMCVQKSVEYVQRTYIMVNPTKVPVDDDMTTAIYLMNLGSHECSHWLTQSYEAHGETFCVNKEDIFNRCITLLPAIQQVVKTSGLRETISKMTKVALPSVTGPFEMSEYKHTDEGLDEWDETAKMLQQADIKLQSLIHSGDLSDRELMAELHGINVDELRARYPNAAVYRMRLSMAIKQKLRNGI